MKKTSLAIWIYGLIGLTLYVSSVFSHKLTLSENLSNITTGIGILLGFSVVAMLVIRQKAGVRK